MIAHRLARAGGRRWPAFYLVAVFAVANMPAAACTPAAGMRVQTLATGATHTSGYLVWHDDKARYLIDIGPGSEAAFTKSGARFEDLDAILLSHLQVSHAGDLPALIHGSFHNVRRAPLPLFGPGGIKTAPGAVAYVRTLFDPIRGAYRYLGDVISPQERGPYKLRPLDIDTARRPVTVISRAPTTVSALMLNRRAPALVWSLAQNDKRLVFLGDADPTDTALAGFLADADIVIAHARPSRKTAGVDAGALGRLAAQAKVDRILLAAIGSYADTATAFSARVKAQFHGPVDVVRELECYAP